jgi:hypothetical protein
MSVHYAALQQENKNMQENHLPDTVGFHQKMPGTVLALQCPVRSSLCDARYGPRSGHFSSPLLLVIHEPKEKNNFFSDPPFLCLYKNPNNTIIYQYYNN